MKGRMSAGYLPQEVIQQILLRLPIKFLLQCMCICKSWHSLIKNSTFISTHLNQTLSSTKDSLFLRIFCNYEEQLSLYFDSEEFTEYKNLHHPLKRSQNYSLIGSCNGLICLADRYIGCRYTFVIWNPSIRKYLTLPRPNVTFKSHGGYQAFLGFGFDSYTNDYKVLRIAALINEEKPMIEVYSLVTGSWKYLPRIELKYEILEYCSQAFVNGVFHFIAFDKAANDSFCRMLVLGFHVGDEIYREIPIPENIFQEITSVHVFQQTTIAIFTKDSYFQCHLWAMKEYGEMGSWTKLLSLENHGEVIPRLLGFRKAGELILDYYGKEMVSYDSETQKSKRLGIHKKPGYNTVYPFFESLVLLDKENAMIEEQRKEKQKEVSHLKKNKDTGQHH